MSQIKNILILTTEFPPQPGGIGTHAFQLAKYLNKTHTVNLIADQRSGNGKEERAFDKQSSFKVQRVKRHKFIIFTYFKRIINSLLNSPKNDVIIVSGKFSLWQVHAVKIFYRKPIVAVIHGSEVLLPNKFSRKLTDKALEKCNHVIAVSNYTLSLVKHLDLKACSVIPNGIEWEEKAVNFKSPDLHTSPQLLTVGNLTQRKGQHNLIRALPLLLKSYPNLHYHCVGIPTEVDKLKKLANKLNVLEAITFHGRLSEKEKNKLYQNTDIFIMLSEKTERGDVEGFGIAILEANCYGLPALGSINSGIEDAIKNDFSGFLVNPHATDEICLRIEEILKNYKQYQQQALSWAQRFDWQNIVAQYNKLIHNL